MREDRWQRERKKRGDHFRSKGQLAFEKVASKWDLMRSGCREKHCWQREQRRQGMRAGRVLGDLEAGPSGESSAGEGGWPKAGERGARPRRGAENQGVWFRLFWGAKGHEQRVLGRWITRLDLHLKKFPLPVGKEETVAWADVRGAARRSLR